MKKAIRVSVFETNSSSTHSVSIKKLASKQQFRDLVEMENVPEREIRSAYEKMLFTWAFECYEFQYEKEYTYFVDEKNDNETEEEKAFSEYLAKEYKIREEGHEKLRKALLDYCEKVAPFDKEEAQNAMDNADTKKARWQHPVCNRYFENDVLDDELCDQCLDMDKICTFFKINYDKLYTDKNIKLFCERLFDEKTYFVLRECNMGGLGRFVYSVY